MFDRFICYACSFGKNGHVLPNEKWFNEGGFPDLISKHYGIELVNESRPGTNADFQFQQVLSDLQSGKLTSNDLIMVQWTFSNRYNDDSRPGCSFMPHVDIPELAWTYTNIYNEKMATDKIMSYTLAVNSLLPGNVVFGFAQGIDHFKNVGNQNLYNKMIKETKIVAYNYIDLVTDARVHTDYNVIHQCFHPNDDGHRYIAQKYIDGLDDFINDYMAKKS